MQAARFLEAAKRALNSQGSSRWPDSELLAYLEDALSQLLLIRPQLFLGRLEAVLVPGEEQEVPAELAKLMRVEGLVDDSGRIYQRFGAPGNAKMRAFLQACPGDIPTSYFMEEGADRVYFVTPGVPDDGGTLRARLIGELTPSAITSLTADVSLQGDEIMRHKNQIVAWMLYRAFATETESPALLEKAKMYREEFYGAYRTPMQLALLDIQLARAEADRGAG